MQPKSDITIYRTQGDTDPIVFDLRVTSNGTTTKIPSTANVTLNIRLDTGVTTLTGSSTANGIFGFGFSVNTANHDLTLFDVRVYDDYEYVIGSGTIIYRDRV